MLKHFAVLCVHLKDCFLPSVSTRTDAVLLESVSDSTSIELYLTVGGIKVN